MARKKSKQLLEDDYLVPGCLVCLKQGTIFFKHSEQKSTTDSPIDHGIDLPKGTVILYLRRYKPYIYDDGTPSYLFLIDKEIYRSSWYASTAIRSHFKVLK